MFFSTSGKRDDTSLPNVMAMMVFCIDSFLQAVSIETYLVLSKPTFHRQIAIYLYISKLLKNSVDGTATYTRPALNSHVSPFRGGAKALRNLLTAMTPQ